MQMGEFHKPAPQAPQNAAAHDGNADLGPLISPDTERSNDSAAMGSPAVVDPGSRPASEFSGIKNRSPGQTEALHTAPAREIDLRTNDAAQMRGAAQAHGMQQLQQPHAATQASEDAHARASDQSALTREATHHTTLQSMIRPDLMNHGMSDPRRFLSIERELSESSAAVKFLEKRLNRIEKDSRIALALAGVAVLLAVLSFVL